MRSTASPSPRVLSARPSYDSSSSSSDTVSNAQAVSSSYLSSVWSEDNVYEVADDVPASSTPDLLSPDVSSPASSLGIPLAQMAFNKRLDFLLQVIVDQRRSEQDSSIKGSHEGYDEDEWISVSQDEYDSDSTIKPVDLPKTLEEHDSDDGDSISDNSSADSVGVWAPSPDDTHPHSQEKHGRTLLTHINKRKHDIFHKSPGDDGSDGDATEVEDEEEHAPRKKAKLRGNGVDSTSTSLSHQTAETASSRKARSLTSASSTLTSTVSTVLDTPRRFSHPIIHPPSEPQHVPTTKREIAEARLKALLKRETELRLQDDLPAALFGSTVFSSEEKSYIYGIEPEFRREVVQWILDVLPPLYLRSEDLYRHLSCSEETRFHAMYLFSRFFLRLGECDGRGDEEETAEMEMSRKELIWDTAFCCLAISTKFYHDFLEPLNPIRNQQFLAISPQLMTHDMFEILQKDILTAFNYEIYGVTPHSFFEELLGALPSLQKILKYHRSRRIIRNEMWEMLQLASLECDVMRFPVSLLTAAVLIEGVIVAFLDEYEQEYEESSQFSDNTCDYQSKAREDVKLVSEDIIYLLGTSETDLRVCRDWLSLFVRD